MTREARHFQFFERQWKNLLKRKHETQASVAAAAGISSASAFTRILKPSPIKDDQLQKLAQYLGVDPLEFGGYNLPTDALRNIDHIYYFYQDLMEQDILSIVSADGFLEVEEDALYHHVKELIQKGVEVRYFYPSNENVSTSMNHFRRLWGQFEAELSNEELRRVQGFKINPSGYHLFGYNTRYVLFSRWQTKNGMKKQDVKHALLYSKITSGGRTADLDCWIRISKKAGIDFLKQLSQHSEPINRLGLLGQNRLDPDLQEAYRKSWDACIPLYDKIRKIIETTDSVDTVINELFVQWLNLRSIPKRIRFKIDYLDIGCGDGKVTQEICAEIRRQASRARIHPVLLETSSISLLHQSDLMKQSPIIKDSFEDADLDGESFDFITLIHSFYLMDVSNLLKLYNLLRKDGWLLVVHAPYHGDILNTISSFVDRRLLRDNLTLDHPYDGKVITEDPFRVYAEDLEAQMRSYFGDKVRIKKIQHSTQKSHFLKDDGQLTDLSIEIADMFTHNQVPFSKSAEREELFKELAIEIDKVATNGRVPNDVWIFSLFKSEVHDSLARVTHGIFD